MVQPRIFFNFNSRWWIIMVLIFHSWLSILLVKLTIKTPPHIYLIILNYWIELMMKWHDRSYRIMKRSKMCISSASMFLIICIFHQTICTCNANYIISHFEVLKFAGHKMTQSLSNNDFNLSGETKKWLINEHIFQTPNVRLSSYIGLMNDPIYFLLYSTSNCEWCRNNIIRHPTMIWNWVERSTNGW